MNISSLQITVLSPHRDDAAFSCGLTIQSLLMAGNSLAIVNICTISNYAPYYFGSPGDFTRQVTKVRRNEDSEFVETLRREARVADDRIELVDLEWQDVPLRWRIQDEHTLAPVILPEQEVLNLANCLSALRPSNLIFVPMALGGHIDHCLTLQAAVQAFPASSLVFYEDLPYACRMPSAQRIPAFLAKVPLSESWHPMRGTAKGLKQEFALCCRSQIAIEVAEELERYAAKHGGKERFLAGPSATRLLTTTLHHEGGM